MFINRYTKIIRENKITHTHAEWEIDNIYKQTHTVYIGYTHTGHINKHTQDNVHRKTLTERMYTEKHTEIIYTDKHSQRECTQTNKKPYIQTQ